MKTSDNGVSLIKGFERFESKAYPDSGGVFTIGYGHTGGVTLSMPPITEPQAVVFLKEDLVVAENAVNGAVKVPLTQNQFDALVSFTFNCGDGAFRSSTLLKKLNAGDYPGAAEQFGRWIHDKGVILEDLVDRRVKEIVLFLTK